MHKILLSIFALSIFQSTFAADVLNFHSKDVIVYRNYLTKIDSVVFEKMSTQDSVLIYIGGVVVYKNNVVKIDSMSFSKFTGCNIPRSSEVVIGTQTWTTTNLNVDKFRNGDVIPEAKTDAEWSAANTNKTPAWCYYLNSVDSGAKYGKMYNWYAVTDTRGLAPSGWHVPSDAEWTTLTSYLGGTTVAGGKMKNTCGWNNGGNGSNTSGFAGLPGGFRYAYGKLSGIGSFGYWWSSSNDYSDNARLRHLQYYDGIVLRDSYSNGSGMSVRCVKD